MLPTLGLESFSFGFPTGVFSLCQINNQFGGLGARELESKDCFNGVKNNHNNQVFFLKKEKLANCHIEQKL